MALVDAVASVATSETTGLPERTKCPRTIRGQTMRPRSILLRLCGGELGEYRVGGIVVDLGEGGEALAEHAAGTE